MLELREDFVLQGRLRGLDFGLGEKLEVPVYGEDFGQPGEVEGGGVEGGDGAVEEVEGLA